MGVHRRTFALQTSRLFPILLFVAVAPMALHADRTLRKLHRAELKHALAPDVYETTNGIQEATASQALASGLGFVEIFKKLFGGKQEEQEEAPTTSEQHRSAWQEEERHAEFAFCSDVGFRGLHPEEGGEEAACWSRCGRVCEGAMFLAEDALPEWRLVPVATRTKPCKTLAKKSAVQVLCKAIKKPTHYDISSAVKQETTFDAEAQQQEQIQQLQRQQMLFQQQPTLTPALAAPASGRLAEEAYVVPETFAAAAYGRQRSGMPHWALSLIFIGVALGIKAIAAFLSFLDSLLRRPRGTSLPALTESALDCRRPFHCSLLLENNLYIFQG